MNKLLTALLLTVSTHSFSQGTSNDICSGGVYPAQWIWSSQTLQNQPASATEGEPKIVQIRNGTVIATYSNFGGDAGYSLPNAINGGDPKVGPFRRKPYTQWQNGDTFEVYPAIYSGPNQQIYVGPNRLNDAATVSDMPTNITIRGITVNGQRPVIVNPSSGASVSNYNQSLIYVDGGYDAAGNLTKSSTNITIENIDVIDSPTGGYLGKAAVYINGGANVTLSNLRIAGFKRHNVNGVLATGNNSGTLLFKNLELDSNGGDNGPAHNAYINASTRDPNFTFIVFGSWSHDAQYGHELKSRAQNTVIEGSYLSGALATPGTQTETYLLDVPDGGTLTVLNNIFVKNYSGNQSNGASLTFGIEHQNLPRDWKLAVAHNTFVALSKSYDDAGHTLYPLFISSLAPGPKTVDSNVYIGYCPSGLTYKDFRGTNSATLKFSEIDLSFRPYIPQLTGISAIVNTYGYEHKAGLSQRTTNALGARDAPN